jgi:hypothetical protein
MAATAVTAATMQEALQERINSAMMLVELIKIAMMQVGLTLQTRFWPVLGYMAQALTA